MENKFRIALLLIAAAGLVGCSDKLNDELGGNSSPNDGNHVYMNVAVAFPSTSTTRSGTEDKEDNSTGEDENDKTNSDADKDYGKDFEWGWADENDVKTMLLVITDKSDNYITHAAIPAIAQSPSDNMSDAFAFTASQKFSRQDISEAYINGLLKDDKTVRVYAFCNYTADLIDSFDNISDDDKKGGWLNWTGQVEEAVGGATASIWSSHSFLMSNAKIFETTFPQDESEWDNYAKENKPFHLSGDGTGDESKAYINPVHVERAAARLDFRSNSNVEKEGESVPNTYKIETNFGESGKKTLLNVQLTSMSLVNMSKNYYYLRRVSDNGQNGEATIGGVEKKDNYVVDTDAAAKQEVKGINASNASDHFNFTLFADGNENQYNLDNWYTDKIEEIVSDDNRTDTWEGYKDDDTNKNKYRIWRYVTENTIPSADEDGQDYSQQKNIQSTGIVFKAKILPGDDAETSNNQYISQEVKTALETQSEDGKGLPVLYLYNGIYLYGGLDKLVAAAANVSETDPLRAALEDVFSHWSLNGTTYTYQEPDDPEEAKAVDEESGTTLTVEICNNILNEENTKEYSIDFMAEEPTADEAAAKSAFKNLITKEKGMTIYEPTEDKDYGWGYYCYYFYWNRHNDNGKASVMGPMEFATVRNNVYKLSVTTISHLGHPSTPDDDPEPVKPENPDEDSKVYLDVKVEVLPWVVRVNDIEF